MEVRKLFTTIGAGVTSFLLVAVLVIELLDFEFSAIIGLPVGLLAGLGVALGLWLGGDNLRLSIRRAVTAYAAFGLTVLALLGLRYVNIGRSVLTFDVIVGGGLAAVVLVYVILSLSDRPPS